MAGSQAAGDRPMHEPRSDYEQGHIDEREGRFDRERTDEPERRA